MGARSDGPPRRREYLDWLRGVAVLLMIDAHLFDSWTRFPDRDTPRLRHRDDRWRRGHHIVSFPRGRFRRAVGWIEAAQDRDVGRGRASSRTPGTRSLRARVRVPASSLVSWMVPPLAGSAEGRHPQRHGAVDCRRRAALAAGLVHSQPGSDLRDRNRRDVAPDADRPGRCHLAGCRSALYAYIVPVSGSEQLRFLSLDRAGLCGGVRRRSHRCRAHDAGSRRPDASPARHWVARSSASLHFGASYFPIGFCGLVFLDHVAGLSVPEKWPDDGRRRGRVSRG